MIFDYSISGIDNFQVHILSDKLTEEESKILSVITRRIEFEVDYNFPNNNILMIFNDPYEKNGYLEIDTLRLIFDKLIDETFKIEFNLYSKEGNLLYKPFIIENVKISECNHSSENQLSFFMSNNPNFYYIWMDAKFDLRDMFKTEVNNEWFT